MMIFRRFRSTLTTLSTSHRDLGLAWLCWLVPLAVGLGTFAVWVVMRDPFSMLVGLLVVPAGALASLAGAVALAAHYRRHVRAGEPRRAVRRRTLPALALLVANFPIAAGVAVAVIAIQSCYTVRIVNESASPVTSIEVIGGDCSRTVSSIEPGESWRVWMWCNEVPLRMAFTTGGLARTAMLDEYPTAIGGTVRATFGEGGGVEVSHGR